MIYINAIFITAIAYSAIKLFIGYSENDKSRVAGIKKTRTIKFGSTHRNQKNYLITRREVSGLEPSLETKTTYTPEARVRSLMSIVLELEDAPVYTSWPTVL